MVVKIKLYTSLGVAPLNIRVLRLNCTVSTGLGVAPLLVSGCKGVVIVSREIKRVWYYELMYFTMLL